MLSNLLKRATQNTAEATGDSIGNQIVNKIKKHLPQNKCWENN